MDKYARSKECTGQMMFAYPAVGLFFFGGTGYRRPELATGTSGEIAFKENLIPHCALA